VPVDVAKNGVPKYFEASFRKQYTLTQTATNNIETGIFRLQTKRGVGATL
jgi:hypothetical protein